jgi:hypothetical protein
VMMTVFPERWLLINAPERLLKLRARVPIQDTPRRTSRSLAPFGRGELCIPHYSDDVRREIWYLESG